MVETFCLHTAHRRQQIGDTNELLEPPPASLREVGHTEGKEEGILQLNLKGMVRRRNGTESFCGTDLDVTVLTLPLPPCRHIFFR